MTATTASSAKLTGIAPQFLVDDLPRSIEYDCRCLGFTLDFNYEAFYASVSRDGCAIHLKAAPKTVADILRRRSLDMSGTPDGTDVANLGLIRPPLVYLGAIALGLVFHAVWPVHLVPRSLGIGVGVAAILVAIALFLSAVRTFRAAGTPVPGNLPSTTIVRTGPYRFSRNPIYLAFSLLQLGLALWINSLGVLITLVPAIALMSFVVIPREERYLEARFPSEYTPYKASVRRWF